MSAETSGGVWRLRPLDADALGRLEPLWRSLHRHHRSVGAGAGPFVPDDLSWKRRRRVYRRALVEGGRILLAESGGMPTRQGDGPAKNFGTAPRRSARRITVRPSASSAWT